MLAEILTITIMGISDADQEKLQRLFPTPLSQETALETAKQLENLSYFSVEGVQVRDQELLLQMSQRYPVEKIVLKGNWAFLDSTLFSQITSFPASGTDTVAIRQLRQQVLDFYILEGYLDARVEVEVVNLDYTSVLVIQIREGSPYVVTDTSFVGRSETGSPPRVLPGTFFRPIRVIEALEHWKAQALSEGYSQADYFFSFERNERTFPGFSIAAPFKTLFNVFNQRRGVSLYIGLFPGDKLDVELEVPEGIDPGRFLQSLRLEQRSAIDEFEIPLLEHDIRNFMLRNGFTTTSISIEPAAPHLRIRVEGHRKSYSAVTIEAPVWQSSLEKRLQEQLRDGILEQESVADFQRRAYLELLNRSVESRIRITDQEEGQATMYFDMRFPRLPLHMSVHDGTQEEEQTRQQALMTLHQLYMDNERSLDDPQLIAQRVRRVYAEAGYLEAQVRVERHVAPDHVGVLVRVDEGQRFRSAGVITFGAENTSRRYIRRMTGHPQMQPFARASDIEGARRVVEAERIFSYSQYTPLLVDGNVHHIVEAEDRDNLFGAVSLGYDSAYGPNVQFRVGYSNVLGRGGEVTATQRHSEKRQVTALEYSESHSFGIPIDTAYTLSHTSNEYDNYTSRTDLFSMMVRYYLQDTLPLAATYWRTSHSYSSVHPGIVQGIDYWPRSSYHHFGLNIRKDGTDNIISPTQGYELSATQHYSLSDSANLSNYHTSIVRGTYYLPPWPRGVIALHGAAGQITREDDALPVPLENRFRLGGANSIRGFKYEDIASRSSGGARIGGFAYDLLSVEYRHFLGNFELVAFYDLGNVYSERLGDSSSSTPYTGMGTGIRYRTPVGPIRLDVARAQSHKDQASDFEIYLTIGYSF
ncbi:BamA/TamA family outer membrane protein [Desulfurispirillum indicum]|uniref:BamA/TamA family outer membrane protein n=1 Tax=Desulfurispirillum indicum TaxID=936456 RepID=UPI001CFBDBBC|nr:outer membrane protein assembly factor [Desulfurispirillum indicum]UCZ56280.1 BamA/TamA family outer membrane protein [Desulfurispirillum indicum]